MKNLDKDSDFGWESDDGHWESHIYSGNLI